MSDVVRVVCASLSTLDVIQVVERMPGINEKILADSMTVSFGGPAANAAGTVVSLGGEALLVTPLGGGSIGAIIRAELETVGVVVLDCVAGTDYSPAISSVLVNKGTGDRSVVSVNASQLRECSPTSSGWLDDAKSCLVDGHNMELCITLATTATENGIPVIFDGGSWKPGTERLLSLVDLALLSQDFHIPSGEDAMDFVARSGCRFVARSDGGGSIRLHTETGDVSIKVPEVDIVDTLGAGDVLHGAVALLVARVGLSEASLPDILRRGAIVASESCRYSGARGWATDDAARSIMRTTVEVGGE